MSEIVCNVAKDLEPLLFPVDQLELMPGNYNQGDIDGVMKSYFEFGQRKAIVAKRKDDGTGVVLAGNTQLQAARRLEWTHIAVSWVTEDEGWDDAKAAAFAITDNETARRGEEDLELKREMIEKFEDDFELLDVTGFDIADLQEMDERIDRELDSIPDLSGTEVPGDAPTGEAAPVVDRKEPTPVISASIIFETDEQRDTWYDFVRWLRRAYTEEETTAERIVAFLQEHRPSE